MQDPVEREAGVHQASGQVVQGQAEQGSARRLKDMERPRCPGAELRTERRLFPAHLLDLNFKCKASLCSWKTPFNHCFQVFMKRGHRIILKIFCFNF